MEYFFDDKPDDYWIDLTPILERLFPNFIFLNHVYHINKKYEIILNGEFNKITFLKSIKYNETGGTGLYPRKSFYSDEKRIHIKSIHIIIGHVFVPNSSPENNNIINHKNSSKGDFLKENLEWCDYKYNNQTSNKIFKKKLIKIKKYDNNFNLVKIILGKEEYLKEGKLYWLSDGKLHNGFYWEKVDLVLEDYLSRHPIAENSWFTNKFITTKKVEANLCGVLRINGKLTVGNTLNRYYKLIIDNKVQLVHRLVYETISGNKLKEGQIIDHIIPVTDEDTNNEYSNLRVSTKKENMNNTITKINTALSHRINKHYYCFNLNGVLIGKYQILADILNFINPKTLNLNISEKSMFRNIVRCVNFQQYTAYGYIWSNTPILEKERLESVYHKYNSSGELIDTKVRFIEYSIESNIKVNTLRYYINTGKLAPDGYYYWQGSGFEINKKPGKPIRLKKINIKTLLLEPDYLIYDRKRRSTDFQILKYDKMILRGFHNEASDVR